MILNLRAKVLPHSRCSVWVFDDDWWWNEHFHFCLFYGRQVLHRQVLQELASSFHQVCTCKFEKEIKIKLGLHDLTEQLLSDHITIYAFKYKFSNIQMNVLTYLGVNYEHCTIKLK